MNKCYKKRNNVINKPNQNKHYLFILKCLHWSIAIIIIVQTLIGIGATHLNALLVTRTLFFIHKSLGLTLLLLGVGFVLWHFCHQDRKQHFKLPMWQRISAKVIHYTLFLLIIIMPLSGWLMSTAAGYPPSFWGLFVAKAPVPINSSLTAIMNKTHIICAWIMTILIIIHVLATLKHVFIDHDGTLKRMWF